MWKIICALLFFQRALSAPSSRCMEICNNRNSQYLSNTNCCASSLVASTNEKKNWTDHKDFQTHDGALVHTKDGEFSHGNTHGNFNEMSYYKEFKSGDNQHFGSNHNFGNSHDISQKLEDLSSSSSHSTFESMFQSRFSDLIKNFHESFRHLQELKTKDQLPVQDCQYPCVPINEQISRLQQDVTAQQQHMQRMREDLWSKMQNQNTVTETEHVIPSQHLTHSNHQTGQVTKETNRYESYQNDKITTSPHITTTITKQPVKYTSHPDQSQTDYYSGSRHESTQNYGTRTQGQYPDQSQRAGQDYYSGSVSRHDSSQNYASGTQDQTQTQNRRTSYPDQSSQNYYSGSGSKLESQTGYNQQNSIHDSRVTQNQNNDQNSSQYGQNYATGIQSQAGYAQDTTNYERRNRVSQAQRADQQEYASGNQNQGQTQGNGQHGVAYGYHASYGSKSYYSSLPQDQSSHQSSAYRTHQNSQSQGYGQHSGYRAQSGYQTDGSQSQGEYNPQGSLTYSHNSMSHSSLTQNNADFGASSNGKLTHGLIQTGSAADCNDEVQSAPYRRYKRHIHSPNHRHHYHHHHHHNHQEQYPDDFSQQQDDFQQGSISSKLDEFGEPTKIEKVPQKEIEDLSQQVEDIRNGKVDTQDLYQHQDQHQDFSQQHKFPEQSQTNYYQTGGFDDFPPSSEGSQTYDQQNHGFDDQYHYSPRGFNQKTVGSLTLDQHARDSFNFNQFPTPVLAPDSNPPAGNQRLDGINSQTPRPAPKPTSRPRNTKPFFNTANIAPTTKNTTKFENINSEKIKKTVPTEGSSAESQQILTPPDNFELLEKAPQHIMKPGQVLQKHENTSFKDISETDQPSQKPKNLFEILSQKTLKQEKKHENPFEDFSQQVTNPLSFQQHENPLDFSHQENLKPFGDFSQQVSNPSEDSFHQQNVKPFGDFSQQVLQPPEESFQKHENPFLDFSQQQNLKPFGDFSHQENLKTFGDFSQQVFNPSEELFHQQNVKPFGDFSQQVSIPSEELFHQQNVKPFGDFPQQVSNPSEESLHQQHENPFLDFSHQQNLKPFQDFSKQISKSSEESLHQQNVKPFEDFSQQVLRTREKTFQQHVNPFEDISQQIQENRKDSPPKIESSPNSSQKVNIPYNSQKFEKPKISREELSVQKPLDDFSQYIQKSLEDPLPKGQKPFEDLSQDDSLQKIPNDIQQSKKNLSEEIEKTLQKVSQHVAQHMQELYKKDLSQTSDLNRNKDITQLPQSQQQDQVIHHLDSYQEPEEISLGRQWHLFHGPGDLTNEDLHLGSHLGQRMEQISTPSLREKEEQLEGKLEFSQIVQNPQIQSELPILSLQPRILQAYGGKGPYDPMHSEDIFSDVRQNPSATFAPVVIDDPWDIRERRIESYMANEDKVIPLDTVWIYPDAFPITPVTEQPNLGFWDRVGRKFSTAVDKAKDKARGIFG